MARKYAKTGGRRGRRLGGIKGGNDAGAAQATGQNVGQGQGQGLGEEIYDGAASFGRFMAMISMIVGVLLGLGLLGFGIYMVSKPDTRTASGFVKATSATCTTDRSGVKCVVIGTLQAADGKSYTVTVNTSGVAVQKDQMLKVNYNPADPLDVSYGAQLSNRAIGWICIGLSLLVIGGGIFWYWVTTRYKFAAAANGVSSGLDLFSGTGSSSGSGNWSMTSTSGPSSYSF